jgi:PKD repeat protein
MAAKPLLAVFLLAALALAGCSGGGDDGDKAGPGSSSSTGSGSVTGTSTAPAPKANHVPSAALNASVATGASPLKVDFTVSGEDPDGDALSWTLAFGDGNRTNGTSLPATASHTYNVTGNSTIAAVLTVSDGRLNATGNVTIRVTAPAAAADVTVLEGEVSMACDTPGLCYVVGANGCLGWDTRQQGLDCVWIEVPADLVGRPFETASAGDVDVEFRSDCEPTGDSISNLGNDGQEKGDIPAGTGCAVLSDFTTPGVLRLIVG